MPDPRRGAHRSGGRHARHVAQPRRHVGGPLAATAKVLAGVLSVAVLASSGVMWGFYRKFSGEVQRIQALPPSPTKHTPDADGTDQNILVVGNDDRAGLTPAQLREVGTDANSGINTDTVLLVHIPADGRRATIISFPRDSYVDIPGYRKNKINSAYADGACLDAHGNPLDCGGTLTKAQRARGAQVLIKTVSNLTGLHIDHYVEVSLLGFYSISRAINGVDVCLARRWYDPVWEKGIDVPPGNVHLEGKLALAFVRERHTLPHGDLDRIRRQQAFISAVIRKVLSAGTLLNPIKVNRLVGAVAKSLTFDQSLDPLKLIDQVRGIAAGNVIFMTMPTEGSASEDGKDVLLVNEAKVRAFFDKVIGKPAPHVQPVPRARVNVAVQNGTPTYNLAATTGQRLSALGFHVVGSGNAERSDYTQTEIRFDAGQEPAARTLAAVIPGARLIADDTAGSTVQLILGSQFTGVRSQPAPVPHPTAHPPSRSTAPPPGVESRTAANTGCVN